MTNEANAKQRDWVLKDEQTSGWFCHPHRRLLVSSLTVLLSLVGMGLVSLPAQAQGIAVTGAGVYDQTRTSSFTYFTSADLVKNGLLKSETIEPNNAQLGVVTTYDYDSSGNKISATTSNLAGATGNAVFTIPRTSTSTYAAQTVTVTSTIAGTNTSTSVTSVAGTFATSAANALNQTETHLFDPRFGAPTSLTGPNGLTTTWQLDNFGRKVKETRADGTVTVSAYCLIATQVNPATSIADRNSSNSAVANGDPLDCTNPTVVGTAAEIPSDAASFVHTEPRDATGTTAIGPFVRVYADKAGRKLRTVTQAFDGASQPGGISRLIVQDIDYNMYGAQTVATQPYFLNSGSSTSTGATHYGMSLTGYDALGRVVVSYNTDVTTTDVHGVIVNAGGSQTSVTFGSRGSYQASKTSIVYGVLSTTSTNDAGQTRREDKNLEGKVILVTDNLGAQVAHQHDAFGNLVVTKDALQNVITIGYDARGRKVSMNDPDAGAWAYDYDALGELVWQQNARAQVTKMAYDALGRMTQRTEPEGISTWSYDTYIGGGVCTKGIGKLCESKTDTGIDRKFYYDNLGRPINTRTDVTNGPSYATAVSFDANGRVSSQTYPSGLQVNYNYTTKGFLSTLTLGTTATGVPLALNSTLWSAQAYNAWGKAEQQSYGNGVINRASFDAMTARLTGLSAGLGAASNVLSQHYGWDSLSHLVARSDDNGDGSSGAVTDAYSYDGIGRLQSYSVSAQHIPGQSRTVTLQYNATGMTLYKSDVGVYSYGTQGAGQSHPHALQSVAASVSGIVSANYFYDASGNLTSASAGKYSTIAYTSFNLPDNNVTNLVNGVPTPGGVQGPAGGPRYFWMYDESHQRIKETRITGSGVSSITRTTWYMHPDNQGGLGFECDSPTNANCASADTSNRHFLSAGGMSIGVLVSNGPLPSLGTGVTVPPPLVNNTITLVKVEYWHKDHLGSLISTTDYVGAVTARYAYDPFGKRRISDGQYDSFGTLVVDWVANSATGSVTGTPRGYTGHEQLDDIGLIHMNGRIFDPTLGVFLQSDPFIQDPSNLQNFNRYGYCYNNPLTCTDPSGQSFWTSIRSTVVRIVAAVADYYGCSGYCSASVGAYYGSQNGGGLRGAVIGGVSSYYAFELSPAGTMNIGGGIGQAAVAGFFAGVSTTGTIEGGLQGAFTAGMFYGAGDFIQAGGYEEGSWQGVAAHGVVGCVTSVVGGSKCGPGALSAAFSQAAMPMKEGLDIVGGTVVSAVIGGTASVLGGGKFSNGAATAAMGYLYNCVSHPGACNPTKADQDAVHAAAAACKRDMACIENLRTDAFQAGLPVSPYGPGKVLTEFLGGSMVVGTLGPLGTAGAGLVASFFDSVGLTSVAARVLTVAAMIGGGGAEEGALAAAVKPLAEYVKTRAAISAAGKAAQKAAQDVGSAGIEIPFGF